MNRIKSFALCFALVATGAALYAASPGLLRLLRNERTDGASAAVAIATALSLNRVEISQLSLPYLQFQDGHLVAGSSTLSEIAQPRTLNIAFLDYQCAFCRADHAVLMMLIRAHPEQRFYICETPLLGPDSVEAARAALSAISRNEFAERHDDLMVGRVGAFDRTDEAGFAQAADRANSSQPDAMLKIHQRLVSALGIQATPTYIIGGNIVFGTIRQLPELFDKGAKQR